MKKIITVLILASLLSCNDDGPPDPGFRKEEQKKDSLKKDYSKFIVKWTPRVETKKACH